MPLSLDQGTRKQQNQGSSRQPRSQQHSSTLQAIAPGVIQRATLAPSRLTASDVIYLQRTIGNRAVAQMLANGGGSQSVPQSPIVQPKLKVGPSNDRYEQEADNIARQATQTNAPVAQRKTDSTLPIVGAKGGMVDSSVEAAIQREKSSGSPLPQSIRRTVEPHLGRDLSQVRTHTNRKSAQLNSQLGAKAFTHGRDIFYGAGQSPNDIQLTAHESTHFVQQQNPPVTGGGTGGNSVQRSPAKNSLSLSQPRIQRKGNDDSFSEDNLLFHDDTFHFSEDGDTSEHHNKRTNEGLLTKIPQEDDFQSFISAGYLQDGGTSRWIEDTTSGRNSRRIFSRIDTSLKLFQQYKSENRGNVEVQGKLLLDIKDALISSRYLFIGSRNKNTKTFTRRKLAATLLLQEVNRELKTNIFRVLEVASEDEVSNELQRVGFSAKFLNALPKDVHDDLFLAHTALSHRQFAMAQEAFDRLNPLERDTFGEVQYKTTAGSKQYLKRKNSDLLFAQQILISHHHTSIGGKYEQIIKAEPLEESKINKITEKYIRNPAFIGDNAHNAEQEGGATRIYEMEDLESDDPPQMPLKTGEKTLEGVKGQGPASVGNKTLNDLIEDYRPFNLTSQEIEAIRIYSGGTYKDINATMHDFRLTNNKEQRNFKGYMAINHVAVSGLSKLPSFSNKTVYRGDGDFGGLANTVQIGTTFNTPSFMSTTTRPTTAGGFQGSVYWYLMTAPDSKGKDIKYISVADEGEVLFPPGTKLRVVDVLRRDPEQKKIDGEEREDMYRRFFRSDRGDPMPDSVLAFLLKAGIGSRDTIIVVQEQGRTGSLTGHSAGKNKQGPNKMLDDQDHESGYLQDGGTSRWTQDTTSGTTSRRAFSQIDRSLKLYRQYKAKGRGNAEAQAKLLLKMKASLESSRYLRKDKNSNTFNQRKQSSAKMLEEVNRELQTNPRRLKNVASQAEVFKELGKSGFTKKFLDTLIPTDLRDLYFAHAALAHGQLDLAQETFDRLNPVERNKQGGIRYKGDYMRRKGDKFHFAQQMLMARHHQSIGGSYAQTFNASPLDETKMDKVTDKYIRNEDFLVSPVEDEDEDFSSGGDDGEMRFESVFPDEGGEMRFESVYPNEHDDQSMSFGQEGEHIVEQIEKVMGKKDGPFTQVIMSGGGLGAKRIKDLVGKYKNSKLTSQELEAIRIYSHNIYQQMNATMHDFRINNPKEQKKLKGYMALNQVAASGLSKLPSYTGEAVYRGDRNFGGMVDTAQIGTTFLTPSFMSTSKAPKQITKFGGQVVWYVKLTHNSKGKDISGIAYGPQEEEVLFPPGTKMKIVDVYRKENKPEVIPGEDVKDEIRRVYQSDSGKPLDQKVVDFIATSYKFKPRNTVMIAQEVGKK